MNNLNATMIGKILVVANAVISLVFLGWAMVGTSTRMNVDKPRFAIATDTIETVGADSKVKTESLTWEQVNARYIGAPPRTGLDYQAESRWQSARTELLQAEKVRRDNQTLYANDIASMRAGKTAVKMLPAYTNYVAQAKGRPDVVVRGRPVQPLSFYPPRHTQLRKEIAEEHTKVVERIHTIGKLTQEIIGLRGEIVAEELILRNSKEEQDWLGTKVFSNRDEADSLQERTQELEMRIELLKKLRSGGKSP